jgi:putative hydrolase of the HAD superfamily
MALKAVLFDLGLTLIGTASFPEIYRRILAKFEIDVSVEYIIRAQKETEGEFDMLTYDEKHRKEFWTRYNDSLLEKLGVEENRLFVASQIDELWWSFSHVQVFPDVKPTLAMLKEKGLKIGLVSNGFKQDLDHVLGELDLENWFDTIVCIDSCNCSKPDKRIFLYALEKLGIWPSEAIFVGDSVLQDYEGASAVGIKPYLIDREGKLPNKYDTIKSLTELLTKI